MCYTSFQTPHLHSYLHPLDLCCLTLGEFLCCILVLAWITNCMSCSYGCHRRLRSILICQVMCLVSSLSTVFSAFLSLTPPSLLSPSSPLHYSLSWPRRVPPPHPELIAKTLGHPHCPDLGPPQNVIVQISGAYITSGHIGGVAWGGEGGQGARAPAVKFLGSKL